MEIVNRKDVLDQLFKLDDITFNQVLLDILNFPIIGSYSNNEVFNELRRKVTIYLGARMVNDRWVFPIDPNSPNVNSMPRQPVR